MQSTRIVSYNLNGIRAAVKKGLVEWLKVEDFDIVGIQETKAHIKDIPTALFEELGYHCHWYSAEKKGYSGVGLLSKQKPDLVETGISVDQYDNEGRVIRADFGDTTVLSCYFPSGTSGDERQAIKMSFLKDIQAWVNELKKTRPKIILMGDYNIANHKIDVYNPDKAHKYSGFLPEEREWLDSWFADDWADAFRTLNPEKQEFSWWSYRRSNRSFNRGWRIDYHSVTNNLKEQLEECYQMTDVVHSDHCPVYLKIKL